MERNEGGAGWMERSEEETEWMSVLGGGRDWKKDLREKLGGRREVRMDREDLRRSKQDGMY